ncbi:HpcH/HpaI aldolase/citrate lyase family protein [Nocardia sp. NPDC051570]|uniref:HpcH/HpaI aldolase/citrate lyase family protein n=1 Tax=Nocardia sp. NPDC051570 TaxID=3364324 RepID=UPI00378A5EC3
MSPDDTLINRRQRRSALITPALRPDRYVNALTCGAAVAIVDLEDSVAVDKKYDARQMAAEFFSLQVETETVRGIRINALTTEHGLRDLLTIADWPSKPISILVPKADSPRDFDIVAEILDRDDYKPLLYALIETPRAVADVQTIAAHNRVAGLSFGAADYAMMIRATRESMPLLSARQAIVNAAHRHGKMAVDSPFFELEDTDSLIRETASAKSWGFHAKGAVHPSQIEVIDSWFAPTPEEIRVAYEILESGALDSGIANINGRMVGAPIAEDAHKTVQEYERGSNV